MLTSHTLQPAIKQKMRKRVGRGNASGHGTYSTRGQKGQRARTGGRRGLKLKGLRFFLRQIPKQRGFVSRKNKAITISFDRVEKIVSPHDIITKHYCVDRGIIKKVGHGQEIKILGNGVLSKPIIVKGIAVSESAKKKIIAAGGKVM